MATTKMQPQPSNLRASRASRFTTTRRPVHAILASSVAALLGVSAQPAFAATQTWSGASSANWAPVGNWSALPSSGDSLVFTSATGSGGLTLSDNLMTPATFNVAGITFNSGAGAFVINPATPGMNGFTLTGGITNNSTSLQTINSAIALSGTQTFTTTAGGGNLALGGVLSGTGGLTNNGPGTLTLSASNSYSGGTTISSGTLNYGNLYALGTGNVTIGTAKLQAGLSGTVGNNIVLGTGATATFDTQSYATTLNGTISGGGSLTVAGTASLILSASNSFTGGLTTSTGTANGTYTLLGNSYAAGSGTITIAASSIPSSNGNGGLILANGVNVPNNIAFYQNSTGNNAIGMITSGTATLSGTLNLLGGGNSWRIGDPNGSTITNTYNFAGPIIGGGGNNFFLFRFGSANQTAVFSNTGNTFSASNIIIYNLGQTTSGTASSFTNTLVLGVNNTLPSSIPIQFGFGTSNANAFAVFDLNGYSQTTKPIGGLIYSANGNVAEVTNSSATTSSTLTINTSSSQTYQGTITNGAQPLSLVMAGGTQILGGSDSYTGGSTINNGILEFSGTASMPATGAVTVNNGGTLAVAIGGSGQFTTGTSGAGTIGGLLSGTGGQGAGVTWNSGAALGIDTSSASGTYAGVIANIGGNVLGLTKTGSNTLTLTGSNSYSGATTISSGTLQLGNANAVQNSTLTVNVANGVAFSSGIGTFNAGALAGSSNFVLSDTASNPVTLSVGGNNATTTYSGVLSGSGSLIKTGTGTLTLTSAGSNYTGATTVTSGILIAGTSNGATGLGSGAILLGGTTGSSNATIQLGSASTTNYSNNVTVQSGNSGVMALNASGIIGLTGTVTLGSTGSSGKSVTIANVGGNSGWTYTLSGIIQDPTGMTPGTAGTVTVNSTVGSGTVKLAASNSYTGGTVLSGAGNLDLGANGALGNGPLTLGDANTNGTIRLELNGYSQTVTGLSIGTSQLCVIQNQGGGAGVLTVALASGTNSTTSNFYFRDQISGTGTLALVKTGAGTLDFSSYNTMAYSGGLTVTGGVLAFNNAAALGNGPITLGGGTLAMTSGASVTISQATTLTAATTSGINTGSGAVTYSGTLSGSGTLAMSGAGTLTLSASNSYSGGTTISAGTLNYGNLYALGSGSVTIGTAKLQAGLSGTIANNIVLGTGASTTFDTQSTGYAATLSGAIGGGGSLSMTGSGQLILSASNSFTGGLTTSAAGSYTLLGNSYAAGSGTITIASSSLPSANGNGGLALAPGVNVPNNIAFNLNGQGNNGLGMIASGTATISGTVTLAGSDSHGWRIGDPGTGPAINNTYIFAGPIVGGNTSGPLFLFRQGSGNQTAIFSGSNTFSASLIQMYNVGSSASVNTLMLGANNSLPSSLPIQYNFAGTGNGASAVFDLSGYSQTIGGLNYTTSSGNVAKVTNSSATTSSTLTINTSSQTYQGTITNGAQPLSLVMAGGTQILSGSDSYTGGSTINSGILEFSGTASMPATGAVTVNNGGTLAVAIGGSGQFTTGTSGAGTVGGLLGGTGGQGAGVTWNSGAALGIDTSSASGTYAGVIANIGGNVLGLTKTGSNTLTLTGSNTYTGATTITGGTLQLGNANAVQNSTLTVRVANSVAFSSGIGTFNAGALAGSGNLVLSDTASNPVTLSVGGNNATTTYSGALSGGGGLVMNGTGAMTLSGSNSYTGGSTINNGILEFSGTTSMPATGTVTVNNGGTLAVATGGAGQFTTGTSGAGTIGGLLSGTGGQGAGVTWNSGATLGIDTSAGNATYAGVITDIGGNVLGLTKLGANTLTLSSSNTYTGTTTIANGTLSTTGTVGGLINGPGSLSVSTGHLTLTNNNNSFSGNINGNNLYFTSIGNYGQNSSLGTGGSNSVISISWYGTMTFTGSTSQTSNRSFSVYGAYNQALNNNGTAALNLTGSISGNAGFTMGGSYNGVNTVSGLISDSGGPLSLGFAGTWLLNNDNNSFSGGVGSNGTLDFTSVGNYGQNSSLGTGGTNSTFGSSYYGSLAFTGSTAQTSNRNSSFGSLGANFYNNGSAPLNLSGTMTLGNSFPFHLGGTNIGNCGTISGPIVGGTSSSFNKDNAGLWTLSGSNTYVGTTSINAGTLMYGKEVSLYNNTPASWTPALIQVGNGATIGFNVGGAGEFTNSDVTTLLTNFAVAASGQGMHAGSTYAFDTTNASGGTFTIPDAIANTTGATGGAIGLTKYGPGTLVLTGSNTYTGATAINGGTLQFGDGTSNTAVSSAGVVTVNAGATLAVNLANSGTFASQIMNFGTVNLNNSGTNTISGYLGGTFGTAINQSGSGTTILSYPTYTQYFGTINVNAGAVQLNTSGAALDSTVNVGAPNGLAFGVTTGTIGALTGTSGFTLLTAGGSGVALSVGYNNSIGSTYSGAISGTSSASALTKIGAGTLTLAGSNSYAGPTSITSGVLQLGNADAVRNSTLTVNVANSVAFSSGIGTFNAGALSGSANLVLSDIASNPITLSAGGNNATTTYSGVLSGNGSLTKTGTGTLNLSSTPAYSGSTTLAAGTLATTGTFGGLIGGPGSLAVYNGTLALTNDSNSFGGNIATGGNTLQFTSIGNYGANSALGTGGSNSVITIGYPGHLVFTGSSVQNSNRNISGAGSSINIFNNGSAALNLSGTIGGNGTLYLGGTSSATNIVSGPLIDSGGALSVSGNNGAWRLTNSNSSFTGNVYGNYLQFTSIGNYGQTSSLGTGGSNSVITIANYGTMTFTGSTAQTSNRSFSIIGTNSTLNNNGTAALNLTGTISGNTSFTMGGSYSGVNTVSGLLSDSGGSLGVVGGGGTWLLNNDNNSFSGGVGSNGWLEFTSVGNYGQNSSLGTGGSNSTIGASFYGSLAFTGSTAQTTNRNFSFGGICGRLRNDGSAPLNLSGTVTVGSSDEFWLQGSNSGNCGTISGPLVGGGTNSWFTKPDSGLWTLSGTNTYGGPTNIGGGTLIYGKEVSLYNNTPASWTPALIQVSNGATIGFNVGGTGEFTNSDVTTLLTNFAVATSGKGMQGGSRLAFDTTNASGGTFTIPDNIANTTGATGGAIGLTKYGTGALVLTGSNSYSGATTINSGTLAIGGAGSLGGGNYTAGITNNGTLQYGSSANQTLGGAISGTGSLIKTGAGTLTLTSAGSSYSGATTVTSGTLIAGTSNGATGIGSNTNILLGDTTGSSNAIIQLGSANTTNFSNNVTVQSGNSGVMSLNASGIINLTGTVTLGSAGSSGQSVTIANVGSDSRWNYILSGIIQDPTGMTPGTSGTVTVGGAGSGTVRFSGANTYSGNTRIAANALAIYNALALQNSTLDMNASDTGSISFNQNSTLGGLTGSRNLDMSGKTLSIGNNGQSTTYSGALRDGALTKTGTGTLTLSGSNSYSGGTTVSSGTLQLGSANALGAATGGLTVNGGTLDLNGNSVSVSALGGAGGGITTSASGTSTLTTAASGTSTYNGNIANGSGAVVLTQTGSGTLILGGSLTIAGLNADGGATQIQQSGSIAALNVAAGATVSMAAHSGSSYNVLNISSLAVSGFNSAMLADAGRTAVGALPAAEPASPEPVPEPGVFGLLLTGALGLLGTRRNGKGKGTKRA